MAEIKETVTVDTDDASSSLKDLQGDTVEADKKLDDLKDSADTADKADVSIPVEAKGAKEAAGDLEQVDKQARAAGDGAKVGVSSISDMTGPLGDASSAAGDFGGAMEGVTGLAEGMAAKLGLSEEATAKMTAVLGVASVAVAAGAAAWSLYNAQQERAKKGAEETRVALESVYEKLRDGDKQAAAQTFVDTMSEKIEKFRTLVGGAVTKEDIAGAMFGDPQSIANVDKAVGDLDGTTRALADVGLSALKGSWDLAKQSAEANIALTDKVAGFFGGVDVKAREAASGVDEATAAYYRNVAGAAAVAAGPSGGGNPNSTLNFDQATYLAAGGSIVNLYPPANTPIAVDQATRRNAQIQGPR